ncbi:MAG: DNA primase, partial [Candidatus Omnitrophica bacterium]|nr:DNA primase [Candidatus Omnitrophota bacterium]
QLLHEGDVIFYRRFREHVESSLRLDQGIAHFREALVKEITGGDSLTGRRMRQDNETFPPTHKIILAANHKPIIHDTTRALWRRIALIPFNYVFEKEEQKKDYHEILLEERDGILQWMIKGCLEWQSEGLGEPREVEDATKAYKTDMDILGEFLDDCCVIDQTVEVTNKALKEAYKNWCQKNGEKELRSKVLSSKLIEKGFKRKENMQVALSRGRGWEGLGIKVPDTDDTDK